MNDRPNGKSAKRTLVKGPTPRHTGSPSQRLRIGPFTLLAVVAAVVILWMQSRVERPQLPVIFPAHVVSSGGTRWMQEPVSVLLLHRKDLQLRPDKEHQIREIAGVEARTIAPLLARLREDEAQMDRFVRQARQQGGASPAALQGQAAPFVTDSGELIALRRAFWSQALDILTPTQRVRAEHLSDHTLASHRLGEAQR